MRKIKKIIKNKLLIIIFKLKLKIINLITINLLNKINNKQKKFNLMK